MQEVFKVAEFDTQGSLRLKTQNFESYSDAVDFITGLTDGTYQVQKVFIKTSY